MCRCALPPGEAFQFDWSEDFAVINGVNTKLQVAHFKLSYSRVFMMRAYLLQTHEMLFDAYHHGLRALGGIPERGIYDTQRIKVIAEHQRVFTRDHNVTGKTTYDWRHYLSVLQRKPGALRNGAPFHELPEGFQRLQRILLKYPGGDREMVDILTLVLLHEEPLVERAATQALASGQASKQHVLNWSQSPSPIRCSRRKSQSGMCAPSSIR